MIGQVQQVALGGKPKVSRHERSVIDTEAKGNGLAGEVVKLIDIEEVRLAVGWSSRASTPPTQQVL